MGCSHQDRSGGYQVTEELEPQDDTVVGTAVRISLLIVALGIVAGGIVLMLTREPPKVVQEKEEQSALPEVRQTAPLEIPQMPFTDITESAGLTFVHVSGANGEKLLPETMGGGGAFLDFDNDGDQDILCINGQRWPWNSSDQAATQPTSHLYANDGQGNFTDVTAGSGLDISFYGNGVACGDYDNDGRVDIFITAVGGNRLFHNEGSGKFVDVTSNAAVGGPVDGWSTSAGFFDYDLDGDLDLFVCNYIRWSRESDLAKEFTLDGSLRAYGRPSDFEGVSPVLWRNDGEGKFTDVSAAAGIQVLNPDTGSPMSKSLGVTFTDLNNDHRLDVIVANDTVQNLLFLSTPDGKFEEFAAGGGIAFDNSGAARGAMGIDASCFRNTDSVGIAIGNFANEMTAMYVCQTPGLPLPLFRDEAISNGVGPVTRVALTFGVLFIDVDQDGRLDLFSSNGHLEEDIQKVQSTQRYEQSPQLLWNCGPEYETEFMVVPESKLGTEFWKPMVGRGATTADIDGDGDADVLIFSSGGKPRLLRNDQQLGHHWLRLKLRGNTSNRDAIGAVVRLTLPDGTTQVRMVNPTRSYQSQTELPITFGLGQHATVQKLSVEWPGGQIQEVPVPEVDQLIEVVETN
ncbi:MAG: CRTAC1 family protein [Planctomycetaceae bacterium]|nr:CRTAC1 family protein [Planctomycetaceae bacterium]